jgi:hypothetical protein
MLLGSAVAVQWRCALLSISWYSGSAGSGPASSKKKSSQTLRDRYAPPAPQPFTAPLVNPAMNSRCKAKNKIAGGTTASSVPARNTPYSL